MDSVVEGLLFDSDDDGEEESRKRAVAAAVAAAGAAIINNPETRAEKYHKQRLDWNKHVEGLVITREFAQTYRMEYSTFEKLLEILRPRISVAEEKAAASGAEPITPELVTAFGIRWIGGGTHNDIKDIIGVSKGSSYRVRDIFLYGVLASAPDLPIEWPTSEPARRSIASEFFAKSWDGVLSRCIGAVDGMFIKIKQPKKNPRIYYSGLKQAFGVNMQAVCDVQLRFTYISVMCPGSIPDVTSYKNCMLPELVEPLPAGYHLVGDEAYPVSEQVLVPYSGNFPDNSPSGVFNHRLSQLRIRIEMAFGRLVNKFRIFRRVLEPDVNRVNEIMEAAVRIHNFIINVQGLDRLTHDQEKKQLDEGHEMTTEETQLPEEYTSFVSVPGSSLLRHQLREYCREHNLTRPVRREGDSH